MKTQRSLLARAGFSLVEVVLALGIATFGLVSILGLLNYATGADGDAGRDTTLVAMSDYILNDLHAAPFDALWAKDPSQAWNAAATMDSPNDSVYYFTNEGSPIPAGTVASNPNLLYMCTVRKALDPLTQNLTTGYYNQLKLQLEFSWPAPGNGTPGKAGTKTLYASIARR